MQAEEILSDWFKEWVTIPEESDWYLKEDAPDDIKEKFKKFMDEN